MPHPISQERVEWLRSRYKVLEKCHHIAQSSMHSMNGGGSALQELHEVVKAYKIERIQIEIELRVLGEMVAGG